MFLLVPAHPGFPGQIPQSRKTVVVLLLLCSRLLSHSTLIAAIASLVPQPLLKPY